jgi:hypothetical protein
LGDQAEFDVGAEFGGGENPALPCDPLLMLGSLLWNPRCHQLECSAQRLIISLQSIDIISIFA